VAAALLAVGCALLASCKTPDGALRGGPSARSAFVPTALFVPNPVGPAGPLQSQLVSNAKTFLGRYRIEVGGRTFTADCTGLVLAIYFSAGMDLQQVFPRYQGGGVARLHAAMDDNGLLHRDPKPDAADLVFWDNTYDENGDRRWNDSLTHVGMVMETGSDGTVVYIHYDYRRGVMLDRMNLARPSLAGESGPGGAWVTLNSPMRMDGTFRPGDPVLAGELFRDYGRAYKLPL
jgi:hypothetical protein